MDLENAFYHLSPGVPTVAEYRRLRVSSGLSDRSAEAAAAGLPNTWFGVVVRQDGEAVGMGRIVGDGGCFFLVVDICVLPEHQGRGLGKRIMDALTEALERAPAGSQATLIADGEARRLYAQYGFREVMPASVGMSRVLG